MTQTISFPSRSVLILTMALFCLLFAASPTRAQGICTGDFINPVSDVCWECLLPVNVAGAPLNTNPDAPDSPTAVPPVCVCPKGGVPVPGVPGSFWEPVKMFDVTRTPGCLVTLNGTQIPLPFARTGGYRARNAHMADSFFHVHYYDYPIGTVMGIATSKLCLSSTQDIDIAWMSELDPTWSSDELAMLLHPEALLFSSVPAQAVCAADCAASSAGLPLSALFWCAGCQGSMYPMTGNAGGEASRVQNSLLLVQRYMFKRHRLLTANRTTGVSALCTPHPDPIMTKRQYRFQMVSPTPQTTAALACNPTGRTTIHYEGLGGEIPGVGEDWGWLMWRKRDCCML